MNPPSPHTLSGDLLRAQLPGGTGLRVLEETGSTNLEARRWLAGDAPPRALVVAQRQTGGKGRLGRPFESPPGGLYMSVLFAPDREIPALHLLTAATAVATCRAVDRLCGLSLAIKWVNDLFYQDKKCCGILAETVDRPGAPPGVIVGIGINYTTPASAFAPGIAGEVSALFPQGSPPASRESLAAEIFSNIADATTRLDERAFLPEYRRRNILPGRAVTVLATPPYPALALGIDDDARLLVQTADGQQKALSAGEVSIRLAPPAKTSQ